VAFDRAVEAIDIVTGLKAYGLTQADLAQTLGVSDRAVRGWRQHGITNARYETLADLRAVRACGTPRINSRRRRHSCSATPWEAGSARSRSAAASPAVHVAGLEVLDLTDRKVRARLAVSQHDLVGDDYRLTRQIAADVADTVDGLLSPFAALPARRTLAVFPTRMRRLVEMSARVTSAPRRLVGLQPEIRARPV